MPPTLSVCIPSYNRPDTLAELLDTVVRQDYDDYEIVVSEDASPAQAEIVDRLSDYKTKHETIPIQISTNDRNLGYDGNFRRLIELARGEYCVFMGDDDLLREGSLAKIAEVVESYKNIGVINRSYLVKDRSTGQIIRRHRHYPGDRFFPAGEDSVISFYRRFVTISGLVVHRQGSAALATDRFDGSLLYQLWLVGNLLLRMDGFYISDFITTMRTGEAHYYSADVGMDQESFTGNMLGPEHQLKYLKGMIDIARTIEAERNADIVDGIVADIGNYIYPFLKLHSREKRSYIPYVIKLARLGMGRQPAFWLVALSLLVFPQPWVDRVIQAVKNWLGRTPTVGGVYQGVSVRDEKYDDIS